MTTKKHHSFAPGVIEQHTKRRHLKTLARVALRLVALLVTAVLFAAVLTGVRS
jgi:hypothetical protein